MRLGRKIALALTLIGAITLGILIGTYLGRRFPVPVAPEGFTTRP